MSTPIPEETLPEPSTWAVRFGYQLKYLQTTLAHETPEVRHQRLEEEVRSGLQAIPPADRNRYLAALAERCPSHELASAFTYKIEPKPEETVEAFIALVPQMSEAQRETVKQRLAELGLLVKESKPIEGEGLAEIEAKLKLGPKDEIDPQRLGKLFAVLLELTLTLDHLVWSLWKNAAPKSAFRREVSPTDFRGLFKRSLTGDAEASAMQVQQQLEMTRQLIAGMFSSFGSAGENYAKQFLQRYAPEAISTAVRAEGGGGLFGNADAKYWKKYTDLAVELTQESIENEVRDSLIKFTENLILGRKR